VGLTQAPAGEIACSAPAIETWGADGSLMSSRRVDQPSICPEPHSAVCSMALSTADFTSPISYRFVPPMLEVLVGARVGVIYSIPSIPPSSHAPRYIQQVHSPTPRPSQPKARSLVVIPPPPNSDNNSSTEELESRDPMPVRLSVYLSVASCASTDKPR
jgi:hypothetical protein